ncbi:MAG: PAS domain S-box protein [Phycisphaerae bacterium]|nr:PAS domain S-box protein [Gemmatimonadaceae bacterium]
MLDPRRMVRWVWLGRAALACAILVAAVFVWDSAEPEDTLVATLSFACAVLVTVASAMYAEVYRRPVGRLFYGLQCVVDLLMVTAVVHITGGWSSQFAALYILVIATAALMLPFRDGLSVAGAACVLYAMDVLWLRSGVGHLGVGVQLGVFAVVAVGSGFIAARLRQAGDGRDALAAQLVKVQLEAADILRTIRSGIISVDVDGCLLYANPAATELLGLHLRSLVGRPVLQALGEVSPQLALLLERTVTAGVRTTRAEGVIRRDGKDIPIGVTTTTADVARGTAGTTATAIFQDISDTKRLQAMHVRTERLEAVAELSASLAHEIKNPLASIRSATEQLARRHATQRQHARDAIERLAERRASTNHDGADDIFEPIASRISGFAAMSDDDADDERVLHALVVREADRLSRLLSEFLDFARAQVTRVLELDAGDVVSKAAQLVKAHPDCVAGVEVSVALSPESLAMEADEDMLHRAVFNLILNAVQAASARPDLATHGAHVHIDIRVAREETGVARRRDIRWEGDSVVISISDDGAGIPEALRDTLFEPFVTTKTGGSGLGLAVVHRAIEAHHGLVLVDALQPGTRFTILLPRYQERVTLLESDNRSSRGSAATVDAAQIESRMTGVAA